MRDTQSFDQVMIKKQSHCYIECDEVHTRQGYLRTA